MKIDLKNILPRAVMDMGYLTAAFGIYLTVQQLVLMPFLAWKLSEDEFAFIILFVTIFNIAGSIIGEECGNALLIKNLSYKESGVSPVGDISRILFFMSALLLAAAAVANIFLAYSWTLWGACACTALLCAWRFYAAACYRLRQEFHFVFFVNAAYAAGLLAGLLAAFVFSIHWICIFIAGEAAAQIFIAADARRRSLDMIRIKGGVSEKFIGTAAAYSKLAVIAAVLLTAANFERFILFNHLDPLALNVFYAASVCSKMVLFLGNPLYSYLLAKFSGNGESEKKMLLRKILKWALGLVPLTIAGAWIFSYLGLRFLYPNYLAAGKELLVPLSFATGIGFMGIMLRPLVMRFGSQTRLLVLTLFYGAVLWSSMTWACGAARLQGAVWALAFSQFVFTAGLLYMAIMDNEWKGKEKNAF